MSSIPTHCLKIERALTVLHEDSQLRPLCWNGLQPYDSYPKLQSLLLTPPLLCSSSLLILYSLSPGRGFCFYKSSITLNISQKHFFFPLLAHIHTLAFSRKCSHFHSLTLFTSVIFHALPPSFICPFYCLLYFSLLFFLLWMVLLVWYQCFLFISLHFPFSLSHTFSLFWTFLLQFLNHIPPFMTIPGTRLKYIGLTVKGSSTL